MLRQLCVGASVTTCNVVIHALVTVVVIRVARAAAQRKTLHPWLGLASVMVATALVLIVAHTLEVFVWSLAYMLVDAVAEGTDAFDFAFVNYTTLGYGDVTPEKGWRLLGPIAAMNGVLLFGWSTAVLFEVLRKTIGLQPPLASSRDG
jgi:polyferredoxin